MPKATHDREIDKISNWEGLRKAYTLDQVLAALRQASYNANYRKQRNQELNKGYKAAKAAGLI